MLKESSCATSHCIPLSYESITNESKGQEESSELSLVPSWAHRERNDSYYPFHHDDSIDMEGQTISEAEKDELCKLLSVWRQDPRVLLMQKAAEAYVSLAEISIGKTKYGRALKFLKLGLICIDSTASYPHDILDSIHSQVLMLCGDVHLVFYQNNSDMQAHQEDYNSLHTDDRAVLSLCSGKEAKRNDREEKLSVESLDDIFGLPREILLQRASTFYERSLEIVPTKDGQENVQQVVTITARLGNVRNELGVFFMNSATSMIKGYGNPTDIEQVLWKRSFEYLERGIKAFEVIDDRPNIALLYSNAARLMRLCAQVYGNSTKATTYDERGQFTQQERVYYNKAFEFYEKAFSALGTRATMAEVWDRVAFELSGAYFSMACVMQDYAPLASMANEQVIKEVQSLMMKSLHYCEENVNTESSPRYQNIIHRMGKIHHRVASLYHHSLRNQFQDPSSKKFKSLAELHYNKAHGYFKPDMFPEDHLQVVAEHLGLYSFGITNSSHLNTTVKLHKNSLELLLREETHNSFNSLAHRFKSDDICRTVSVGSLTDGNPETAKHEEAIRSMNSEDKTLKLLGIFEKNLHSTLKELVKIFSSKQTKLKPNETLDIGILKKMYETVIRGIALKPETVDNDQVLSQRFETIAAVLLQLSTIYFKR